MKKLDLTSSHYQYLEQAFKNWLDVLGYAPSTVYNLPLHAREFLAWLECQGHTKIQEIDNVLMKQYYEQLSIRSNQRRIGGLSPAHLNKHIQALERLSDYLRQACNIPLPQLTIKREQTDQKITHVLTTEQIDALYQTTYDYEHRDGALAIRDRAILSIFYACGLRRNEGYHLNIKDVDLERRVIHVRKGKNYKQRLVPFNHKTAQHLTEHRFEARPALLAKNYRIYTARSVNDTKQAFFVTERGTRMQSQSMALRLKTMQQRTDDPNLEATSIHLHLLRHSIATHLLQKGLKIEQISRFLGHSTLEATQIYTHLVNE